MKTWEIRLRGIVQGVGFRPFVFRLAKKMAIHGQVQNGTQGLYVVFNATEQKAKHFFQALLDQKPTIAYISQKNIIQVQSRFFEKFEIVESEHTGPKKLMYPPDYALCHACNEEMNDPDNRRFAYPFITCTYCGPRYSIINTLPYDRPFTAMHPFEMCEACQKEYHDPENRRYFSQTNSCPSCGVNLTFKQNGASFYDNEVILEKVIACIRSGQIITIKGIGGYLLCCAAGNEKAVTTLRKRKRRPTKPFAVMIPSLDWLPPNYIDKERESLLNNEWAPVVLVKKLDMLAPRIDDGLRETGVMLPYAPLFQWIMTSLGEPIVATSANHGKPIACEAADEDALWQVADAILSHNRSITMPQDDRVVRFSAKHQQQIILRRARGIAPNLMMEHLPFTESESLLAMGADMKAAFGLSHQGQVYISQYIGSLGDYDTSLRYQHILESMTRSLEAKPQYILHDMHPGYESSHLAKRLSDERGIPLTSYQHHEAHFAAILGEKHLLNSEEPVLGCIWDGTGYGKDGNMWGGEWMRYQNNSIERLGHLAYFAYPGGDRMAMEPRLSALALLPEEPRVREMFNETELRIYSSLIQYPKIKTSSMGRLFDAVAAVLGLGEIQSYEGEVAMQLESQARAYFEEKATSVAPYRLIIKEGVFDASSLMQAMLADLKEGLETGLIAAKLHLSLAELIAQLATHFNIQQLAFSGGVFQNALLVDLIIDKLGESHQLFSHEKLPPNDENIAFGQLILHKINAKQ
jgi:hydrogenase maturation protein HypF